MNRKNISQAILQQPYKMTDHINDLVAEWLRLDKDVETRSYIQSLADRDDKPKLKDLLCSRLTFGTAGLRAQMGAGFSRINSLTIIQTSQGLSKYFLERDPSVRIRGVVIGHDARHNSEKFAKLCAAAFVGNGFKIYWFEILAHTPLVPYMVRKAGAALGIMITASHNPAQDNGYKVYGSNSCQINSPVDKEIAASILDNLEPLSWKLDESSPLLVPAGLPARLTYKKHVAEYLRVRNFQDIPAFVYTPMHGVGLHFMSDMLAVNFNKESAALLEHNIHPKMVIVTEQSDPDPDFSTVQYPNPEEDGALDLAKKTADRAGIRLIIANDPDADRFAAAEKVDDTWHQFTGDQIGVLLAHHILANIEGNITNNGVMINSAVSSEMLMRMAQREGFSHVETLTGFKWIGNKALDLERDGMVVHLGYEEALGYMFPYVSYDKDGVVAAGVFLKACAEWGSPYAKLQELYHEYGYFETMNTYWRSSGIDATKSVFEKIRNTGLSDVLPQFSIDRRRDLSTGFDSSKDNQEATLPSSPSTQMITCWLVPARATQVQCDGIKLTIRASGTEPKIKIYLECWDSDAQKAREGATAVLKGLKQAWFSDEALVIEEKYKSL